MKIAYLIVAAAGISLGWIASFASHPRLEQVMEVRQVQCSMHPWITAAQPGKCTVCGMDLVPSSSTNSNASVDAVMLPPESIRAVGLQTAEVKRLPLTRTLRFGGKFEEDATTHAVITAPVEGRIDGLGLVHDNRKVVQREPLATMYSRTLLSAAKEYKDALNHDEAAAAVARQKLEHYGLVWEQIKAIPLRQENDQYFGILSPRTGLVVKSYVFEGQYVLEGDKLFEITDSTKFWFMFPVFEQDLPLLENGQLVEIETPALVGEKLKGPITAIGRHLDEETHAVHVRVEIEDKKGRIPRGANGTGVVRLSGTEVLAVPRTAVLWPGGAARVYVETQDGVFEPRVVQLGRCGDAAWEVLSGLKEGERVVIRAGMLIDGQTQLNVAAQ